LALSRPVSGSTAGIIKMVGNTLFKTLGMRTEVMISSQSSNSSFLCLVIPTSVGIDGVDRLQHAIQEKMTEYPEKMPWSIQTISVVTAVGNNLNHSPAVMAKVFEALEDIQIYGLAMGPSNCSISVAISTSDTHHALERIHQLAVKTD
jgi:aspartokinase